jgi:DNA-directed RNA polymerase specialized sigma24 family protein
MATSSGVGELVGAAATGDRQAWDELVDRYSGLLWSIAMAYRLGRADAADVVQTVWLRLLENLDKLRDPDRVGAWLATTARRECQRTLVRTSRVLPTDDDWRLEPATPPSRPRRSWRWRRNATGCCGRPLPSSRSSVRGCCGS